MRTDDEAGQPHVLVIDDAQGIRSYLSNLLHSWGYRVELADSGEAGIESIQSGARPGLVLLDLILPGMSGLDTLKRIHEVDPGIPVAIISVVSRAPVIVEAMQCGAADFINKPFEDEELRQIVSNLLPLSRKSISNRSNGSHVGEYVWESASMREIRGLIEQISDTDVTVLIQGESGVGKEVVARTIHELSNRADQPFIKVNCAALPEDLLESELFGYEKGAFTGANGRKVGKFEVAHGGTIFLDEIGEMSPSLQAKLLQVLQDSSFSRLGGNREIRVDVRVICATHRELLEMIAQRVFREDLYFRLNVVNVQIPPLRDQREIIPKLVEAFTSRYYVEYDRPAKRVSDQLMAGLVSHPFPGNVRELENMVKRIIVLGSEEPIFTELSRTDFGRQRGRSNFYALLDEIEQSAGAVPLREVSRRASLEIEREAIDVVLHQTSWNRKQAAKLLGVSYKTLLQKIRDCELEVAG